MHITETQKQKLLIEKTILYISVFLTFVVSVLCFILKTNNGDLIISDIAVESHEGFPYPARLYKPVSASSINPLPAAILTFGKGCDRRCGDYAASALTKKGFVVLSIESFGQGEKENKPDYLTQNSVDAGYMYLSTKSYTDSNRINLAAWTSAAENSLSAKHLSSFSSVVFVSPDEGLLRRIPSYVHVYRAKSGRDDMIAGTDTISFIETVFAAEKPVSRFDAFKPGLLLSFRFLQIILLVTIIVCAADLVLDKRRSTI